MTPRMDTRIYTNLILTAIAVMMAGGVARDLGIGFADTAQAQTQTRPATRGTVQSRSVPDLSRTDTGVVVDSTIPQTQDVAVAAATSEVAASNREIAVAIHELALAVREGSTDIRGALERGANKTAAPASAPVAAAAPSERPQIEVSR